MGLEEIAPMVEKGSPASHEAEAGSARRLAGDRSRYATRGRLRTSLSDLGED